MNRRMRTIVVLAIAFTTATLATFVVYKAVAGIPVREVEVAHQYVVVAAQPLSLGTRLAKEHLKAVAWPNASVIAGSFESVDALVAEA